MLTARLAAAGVDIVASAHGADSGADLVRQMRDRAENADLVITTGDFSVGQEDHMKPAVMTLGGAGLFGGVAIKPGKPVTVGRIGQAHWLGLPGNPAAAFVTFQVFGMALVRALTGEATEESPRPKPARRNRPPLFPGGWDVMATSFQGGLNLMRGML